MENRYNNRDFEQFLKQNADQYRMFPSEKVWNNIHNTLHVRRRWYGIGIALLLISITAVTLVMVNHPNKNQPLADSLPVRTALPSSAASPADEVFIGPAKQQRPGVNNHGKNTAGKPAAYLPAFFSDELSNNPVSVSSGITENIAVVNVPAVNKTAGELAAGNLSRTKGITLNTNTERPLATRLAENSHTVNIPVADNIPAEPSADPAAETKTDTRKISELLTIESVTNSYKYSPKAKKLSLMVSFTPVISYRDLKENTAFLRRVQAGNSTPLSNVYVPDINSIVTHKPDLGFQLGVTAGYPLSKRFTLTGGIQFSVSKYDIKAYSYQREQTTIALSNDFGGTNTVSTFTNYRNIGGFRANWLRNLYVSASMPIGLEMKVASGKKGYVGVGSTVQPTYVLDNRSYLLSTDYKNYAEMPSLIRKWNINTSFEVFASNTTGKVKWRLGPQVRYQAMSSFKNKYPVKEHLFDFGFKLGVMLR